MISNQVIETFAREVLGCTCSDEVFQHIELEDNNSLGQDSPLSYRINIGHRLLIYVAPCPGKERLDEGIRSLLMQGKQERDTQGFNRFRLVLTTDQPGDFFLSAQEIFKASNPDDKLHVHVIDAALCLWHG